jgi:6-phosphofructokinase 1
MTGSAFGVHAVDCVAEGRFDRLVAWQHRRVVDVPLTAAFEQTEVTAGDETLVRTARGLGICLGDQ